MTAQPAASAAAAAAASGDERRALCVAGARRATAASASAPAADPLAPIVTPIQRAHAHASRAARAAAAAAWRRRRRWQRRRLRQQRRRWRRRPAAQADCHSRWRRTRRFCHTHIFGPPRPLDCQYCEHLRGLQCSATARDRHQPGVGRARVSMRERSQASIDRCARLQAFRSARRKLRSTCCTLRLLRVKKNGTSCEIAPRARSRRVMLHPHLHPASPWRRFSS